MTEENNKQDRKDPQTHFGFKEVPESEKEEDVRHVFDSVARRYDLMNDLLSLGLHRFWKSVCVREVGLTRGSRVLDIASGTCDLAIRFGRIVGEQGEVWATDINRSMLGEGLKRLSFRMEYEDRLLAYLKKLDAIKPVIYTGDLNVAHERIDIKNPDANVHNAGFTPEERAKMDALLSSGFADTFRRLHPEEVKYSWWSYRFHARENNAGWRIDYFLVSERILSKVNATEIHNEIYGSDHCPVLLDIEV